MSLTSAQRNALDTRMRERLRRDADRERMTGNQIAPDFMRQYKANSQPRAHKGELGLTVDADGEPVIARDGKGGVPPSPWELMLLEENAKLCREIAMLRAALAQVTR